MAPQLFGRHLHLRPADVGGAEQDLAVDVRLVDHVVVDHRDRADTGGHQRLHHGAPEPARADDQHPRPVQRLLAF